MTDLHAMSPEEYAAHEGAMLDRVYPDTRKGHREGRTTLDVEEYRAPSHWASALVNGDRSGLTDAEERDLDAWTATLGDRRHIVDVDDGGDFGAFYFPSEGRSLGCDLATYTALVERDI